MSTEPYRPGLYIVLHINAYTDKLAGGYLARRAAADNVAALVRVGKHLTRAEVLAVLIDNPDIQVRALRS